MLAAGYRKRGDTFVANAVKVAATPQEEPFLTRARASYQRSIELYLACRESVRPRQSAPRSVVSIGSTSGSINLSPRRCPRKPMPIRRW